MRSKIKKPLLRGLFTKKTRQTNGVQYASFNRRLFATSIDLLVLVMIMLPVSIILGLFEIHSTSLTELLKEYIDQQSPGVQPMSWNSITNMISFLSQHGMLAYYLIANYVVPIMVMSCYLLFFWMRYNATPGKMLTKCEIVDAKTLGMPTKKQYVLRFIGYILSTLTLTIGFLVIGANKRKRGLHDFVAGTVVVVKLHKLHNTERAV